MTLDLHAVVPSDDIRDVTLTLTILKPEVPAYIRRCVRLRRRNEKKTKPMRSFVLMVVSSGADAASFSICRQTIDIVVCCVCLVSCHGTVGPYRRPSIERGFPRVVALSRMWDVSCATSGRAVELQKHSSSKAGVSFLG
jgi:hypothetical protein